MRVALKVEWVAYLGGGGGNGRCCPRKRDGSDWIPSQLLTARGEGESSPTPDVHPPFFVAAGNTVIRMGGRAEEVRARPVAWAGLGWAGWQSRRHRASTVEGA